MTGCVPSRLALRDRIVDRWMATTRATYRMGGKRVYYLSLEFLIGRLLRDGLNNIEPPGDRRARRWPPSASIST